MATTPSLTDFERPYVDEGLLIEAVLIVDPRDKHPRGMEVGLFAVGQGVNGYEEAAGETLIRFVCQGCGVPYRVTPLHPSLLPTSARYVTHLLNDASKCGQSLINTCFFPPLTRNSHLIHQHSLAFTHST